MRFTLLEWTRFSNNLSFQVQFGFVLVGAIAHGTISLVAFIKAFLVYFLLLFPCWWKRDHFGTQTMTSFNYDETCEEAEDRDSEALSIQLAAFVNSVSFLAYVVLLSDHGRVVLPNGEEFGSKNDLVYSLPFNFFWLSVFIQYLEWLLTTPLYFSFFPSPLISKLVSWKFHSGFWWQ